MHAALKDLLGRYPRPVVHLRRQFKEKRFGLILGAGVGIDFKIPLWRHLVANIANDPEVNGVDLIDGHAGERSLPYKTEMLFQHFRSKALATLPATSSDLAKQGIISAKWSAICAKHLYKDADIDTDTKLKKALSLHPYFEQMLPLVRGSALTITFNFDDLLERCLALKKDIDDATRGFEVVTDPWPQFRRANSVIYHPHGMVPAETRLMEVPVDRFVFSESAYSAQYVGSRGHDSNFLLSHLARNTCLLVGCALEDDLKNVLMRGAQLNPGSYHYYIDFVRDDKSAPNEEQMQLIADTNFNVYNLITLFLKKENISSLFKLINTESCKNNVFSDLAKEQNIAINYHYYLTGAIGVGKSTTASLLRNLNVLDEWQEVRPAILAKPWDELTEEERREADSWITNQFKQKNTALRHLELGISIIDRPPLDPLTFSKKEDRPQRAKDLLDSITVNRAHTIAPGVVIVLIGDPEILAARVSATGREDYSVDKLERMQAATLDLYDGAEIVQTKNMSVLDVTKRVAQIIHRSPYNPFNLQAKLEEIERAV